MKPLLGIIGGMGPRATVAFEQRLLDAINGNDQAIPAMITINDGSIPDRSAYLCGDGDDPVPLIQHAIDTLEKCGATLLCMPCNTACAEPIFSRLQTTSAPLINLPQVVVQATSKQNIQSMYLLATSGTVMSRTYQAACAVSGMQCTAPGMQLQPVVDTLIATIKRGQLSHARVIAERLCAILRATEHHTLLLGCTELPLVNEVFTRNGFTTIDTINVLAQTCVTELRRTTYNAT